MCVRVQKRERVCVCVCKRERECVRVQKRERVRVCHLERVGARKEESEFRLHLRLPATRR